MSKYADLAAEIEQARKEHLDSFGGSPAETARKRSALEQLLRNDVFTIIEALRIAAVSNGDGATGA